MRRFRLEFRLYYLLTLRPLVIFLTPTGLKYALSKIRGVILVFNLSFKISINSSNSIIHAVDMVLNFHNNPTGRH